MLGNALRGNTERRHGMYPGSPFIRRHVTATRGRPVSIPCPLVTLSSASSALGIFNLITNCPRTPPSPPSCAARFRFSLVPLSSSSSSTYTSTSASSCSSAATHPRAALSRTRPDEKLSSLDRDGIIGQPTLFMAFIFLEIAAGAQPVRHFSPSLSLASSLASSSSH